MEKRAILNLFFIIWWIQNYFGFIKGKINEVKIKFRRSLKSKLKSEIQQVLQQNKSNEIKNKAESKQEMHEKIFKLKLLNNLLLERIKFFEETQEEAIGE